MIIMFGQYVVIIMLYRQSTSIILHDWTVVSDFHVVLYSCLTIFDDYVWPVFSDYHVLQAFENLFSS